MTWPRPAGPSSKSRLPLQSWRGSADGGGVRMPLCAKVLSIAALLAAVGCATKDQGLAPTDGGAMPSAANGDGAAPDAPAASGCDGSEGTSDCVCPREGPWWYGKLKEGKLEGR